MSDPDLDAFFDSERSYEETPPPEARLRVRDAVLARLSAPGGRRGEGTGETAGEREEQGRGAGSPTEASPATVSLSRAVMGMIGTFLVGGAIGAAAMRATAPASQPRPLASGIATVAASAPKEEVATSMRVPEAPTAASSGLAVRELPRAAAPPVESAGPMDARGIAAERALLDAARVALANGESAEALALVDRHDREFRRGRLAEEREALAVRALVKAGRYDEARARGARFKTSWPRSLAMPAVTGALESIP